jgi:hypothetical protein
MLRERRILISIGVAAVLVVATVVALLLTGDDGEPPVADETEPTPPTTTIEPTTTSSEEASLEGPVEGPLTLDGEDGLVIEGITVSNPEGNCVEIAHSRDITIRDSQIGPCGGYAVAIDDSSSVYLEDLTISQTESGIYAHASETISVVRNVFADAGRNFVQFDKVTGSGNQISDNEGRNQLGQSDAEDMVSIYSSSGTDESPLLVVGNVLAGGGPSESGSGIMIGDNGGSDIVVEGNTLTNPGQVGIGVSGGTEIRVIGNEIFSDAHPWSNVGIYVWNQSDESCGEIEVRGNRVDWLDRDAGPHPSWDSGDCGEVAGWDDNEWNADLG